MKKGRLNVENQKFKTKQSAWPRCNSHKNDQAMPWNICKYFEKNIQQSYADGQINTQTRWKLLYQITNFRNNHDRKTQLDAKPTLTQLEP